MRFLAVLLLFTLGTSHAQIDCVPELDKDSIKVLTCPRADSRYKTVKSFFTVNASLGELAHAILDIDGYVAWQYKTQSASVLKQVSEREVIYYTRVEAPVLTQDRDFVIRLTVDPDPKTKGIIVEAVSMPEYIPPVEDVIRVPYSRARWNIRPAAPGTLAVEYIIDIDLGGTVPPWLVNLVAPKAPYETFKALKTVMRKYRGKRVSFISE
jgi:START domain